MRGKTFNIQSIIFLAVIGLALIGVNSCTGLQPPLTPDKSGSAQESAVQPPDAPSSQGATLLEDEKKEIKEEIVNRKQPIEQKFEEIYQQASPLQEQKQNENISHHAQQIPSQPGGAGAPQQPGAPKPGGAGQPPAKGPPSLLGPLGAIQKPGTLSEVPGQPPAQNPLPVAGLQEMPRPTEFKEAGQQMPGDPGSFTVIENKQPVAGLQEMPQPTDLKEFGQQMPGDPGSFTVIENKSGAQAGLDQIQSVVGPIAQPMLELEAKPAGGMFAKDMQADPLKFVKGLIGGSIKEENILFVDRAVATSGSGKKGSPFKLISEAVEAVKKLPKDELKAIIVAGDEEISYLHNSLYFGNLFLEKISNLRLIGGLSKKFDSKWKKSLILINHKSDQHKSYVAEIKDSLNIGFEGFIIKDPIAYDAEQTVNNSDDCKYILSGHAGFLITNSNYISIKDNHFVINENAVETTRSKRITISDNRILSTGACARLGGVIRIDGGGLIDIANNNILAKSLSKAPPVSASGISISGANEVMLLNNHIYGETIQDVYGGGAKAVVIKKSTVGLINNLIHTMKNKVRQDVGIFIDEFSNINWFSNNMVFNTGTPMMIDYSNLLSHLQYPPSNPQSPLVEVDDLSDFKKLKLKNNNSGGHLFSGEVSNNITLYPLYSDHLYEVFCLNNNSQLNENSFICKTSKALKGGKAIGTLPTEIKLPIKTDINGNPRPQNEPCDIGPLQLTKWGEEN
ncbi:MAG: hypothetical protein ABIE74_07515 [Pseudomonadota bacterium]